MLTDAIEIYLKCGNCQNVSMPMVTTHPKNKKLVVVYCRRCGGRSKGKDRLSLTDIILDFMYCLDRNREK
jgi:hypothetical protein